METVLKLARQNKIGLQLQHITENIQIIDVVFLNVFCCYIDIQQDKNVVISAAQWRESQKVAISERRCQLPITTTLCVFCIWLKTLCKKEL